MDCEEYGSIAPDARGSDSADENACVMGSDHVMGTVEIDRDDGLKRVSLCSVARERRNTGEEEPGVSPNSEGFVCDTFKVEAGGLCSEKENSARHGIHSVSPSEVSHTASCLEHKTEVYGRCIGEIKRMEDGNRLESLAETLTEGSDDSHAFHSKATEHQEQEPVLKELELTHRFIREAVVPVDCNEQEDGKDSQDVNYSVVPAASEGFPEKSDPQTKEDEGSGGIVLPSGGSETDTKYMFVTDAQKQCEALESIKDTDNVEIGGGGISCASDARIKDEINAFLSDQVAASSDDASCVPSYQSLSDSILYAGGLSCSAAENDWKASSETGAVMETPISPPVVLPRMLSSQTKEDDSNFSDPSAYDLEGIEATTTITPDLKPLHEADLHSNFPNKSELMLENLSEDFSADKAPDALKDNNYMATDTTAEILSQVPPVEENARGSEVGHTLSESSLKLNFPSESEKGTFVVPNSDNTVECLTKMDNNGRIGGEIASASGSNGSETVMSYSRRKGRNSKQSKRARTKQSAARPKKSSRKKQPEKSFESIFKCSKQKRSCISKPARSSEWGLPSCTAKIFLQSNNLPFDEHSNQGSQKSQSNRGNIEPSKSCRNGHPEGSNIKSQTSSGCCLRLKVKFGKLGVLNPLNVTVPEVIHNSSSANDNGKVGAGLEIPLSANCVKEKLQASGIGKQSEGYNIPIENISVEEPADSLVGVKLERDDFDAQDICQNLAGDAMDDDLSSGIVVEESRKASENHYMGAETSPDSEVINSVPDAIDSAGQQGDLHHTVLSIPEASALPADAINRKEDKNKGLKKDKSLNASRSLVKNGLPLIGSQYKSKQPKSQRKGEKKREDSHDGDVVSPVCEKSSTYTYLREDFYAERNSLLRETELGVMEESLELGSCKDAHPSIDLRLGGSHSSKKVLGSAKSKGRSKSKGAPKTSKCNVTKKGNSKTSGPSKSRERIESGEGEEKQGPLNLRTEKEEGGCNEMGRVESHETTGCLINRDAVKTSAVNGVMSPDITNVEMILGRTIEESASTDSAWVLCDDCFKWRRISASLVGMIDENSRWICMNNLDKYFADCSIPQEMSNEEINAELGITQDEADAYDGDVTNKEKGKGQKCKQLSGNQKACFKAIKTNQFLHRNRKTQTIDEIMVCHCRPPPDGRLGCGEECLNRMLNIECVQGTCPCGDFCSNQQLQKRKYVKFERFQSGKKGYGLRLLDDVRKGQFLIEYVGEVLDLQAYEARQKDYAAKGQKHFYFMTLNGNEVIDAGSKGNLGRFINHSCEPNCRTEKWMVNGEICVGIFSLQDIKKGEEVTFDYNYVRVFGAAAKKCYCGSSHCRGYIGGDPLNGDVVVQSDSDEESFEPIILEDDEIGDGILDVTSRISIDGAEVQIPRNLAKVNGSKDHAHEVSIEPLQREILPTLQPSDVSKEHTAAIFVPAVQQKVSVEGESISTTSTSVSVSKLSADSTEADKKSKHGSVEDKKMFPRSCPLLKTSRSAGSSKRDKGSNRPSLTKTQIIPANRLQQQPVKSKGSEQASPSGQIETFEGKLNELLDTEGGISKRKDSTKGYLKLLLLTAASRGNASNEGIQSNRDLSMILDALLKTKSRSVLMDVINKNGLQMLHNIMKQYRRDFKKTPILRKLLKVLEYLATREILTLEHIIRRPPCLGMESFKDSILTLTEHDDKQVHQIARNFRDRWIPKPFRRPYYLDRDERLESTLEPSNSRLSASMAPQFDHLSSRPIEPVASVLSSRAASSETVSASEGGSEPNSNVPEASGTRIRKRKSRWDQPAMTKEQRMEPSLPQKTSEMNGNQDTQDNLPPGFSSPPKQPSNKDPPDAVISQMQGKFLSRLPVSYGIPWSIVHEFGSPNKEDPDSWYVAPGIPFQPFPPLPPVSRDEFFSKKNVSVSASGNEDGNSTCSPVFHQACWNIPGAETISGNTRKRWFSSDIGQRYFRQQKWNVPPWIRSGLGNNQGKQC
ncbi:PREDICTED: histone-lysine N-methyltransferase ASHH2 [Tarenaya hassleriana]|uniref:histone-lysine N-methyltransferase ASHH2 n=1 Tax=Tarenaya hassleriana TaxID=28532 RepID=UPI00053C087C|nr:PREDICTED: histone-lysine N-methyltransferase ASHH2 [Tarenaya hassleriana]